MDEQAQVWKGVDAKQLLENPLLNMAFNRVEEYITSQELTCTPDDKDRCQRLIISKQLLAGVKREIHRVIQNGELAKVKVEALEKRS